MLPPLPHGWTTPPPPKPLLPAAVSGFLWRTFWVILLGGVIVALGFFGIARLTEITQQEEMTREATATTQAAMTEAIELRARAAGVYDAFARYELLQQSLAKLEEAAGTAPTREIQSVVATEAARAAMLVAREGASAEDWRVADFYTQTAIRWADQSGDPQVMDEARRFRAELFGG